MASMIYPSDDINIFCNKIFQISGTDDNAEEPYLILSFIYDVNGERLEYDIIMESEHNLAECNAQSLRALINEQEYFPLCLMIDLLDEIIGGRISNIVASSMHNCVGVERLKILQVNVFVEQLHKRRMNLLQKNVNQSMAMEGKENEVCAICLQEMGEGEDLALTPCIHRFHCACIGRWFEKSSLCPLCRFKIDPS